MNPRLDLVKSVLARNNFTLELEEENSYLIKQDKRNSPIVNAYYVLAIVTMVIGCLVLFWGSLLGLAFLGVSIPIFLRVFKLKDKQKNNYKKQIALNKNCIKLSEDDEVTVIKMDAIIQVIYDVDREKNLSLGTVIIETEKEDFYIIEIFGDYKRYVEDDVKVIAHFIADVINTQYI